MDHLAGWDVALDHVQEAKELLVPMALHVAPNHGAVEHVESSEQGRRESWVIVPDRPLFIGRPGWVRSRAWIWLFSSIDSTIA